MEREKGNVRKKEQDHLPEDAVAPSLRVARRLTSVFRQLCHDFGVPFDGRELNALEDEFAEAVSDYLQQKNSEIFREVRRIASHLEEVNAALRAQGGAESVDANPLGSLRGELGAVLENNEEAADSILSSCEDIRKELNSAFPEDRAAADRIDEGVNRIFEACHFQDLNGQRIRKAMAALSFVEEATGDLIAVLARQLSREPTEAERLLGGPALRAVSQEEINRLFDSF